MSYDLRCILLFIICVQVREAKGLKIAGREASFVAHAQRDGETKRDNVYIPR